MLLRMDLSRVCGKRWQHVRATNPPAIFGRPNDPKRHGTTAHLADVEVDVIAGNSYCYRPVTSAILHTFSSTRCGTGSEKCQ